MIDLTDDTTAAVPASPCCDPRIVAVLAAADEHVAYLDAVLEENERVIDPLRDGTSWSSPTAELVSA